MAIQTILKILELSLDIWHDERAVHFRKELSDIKKDWYEAYNKVPFDANVLDNIELRLKLYIDSFTAQAGTKNTSNPS
jgi:hypothetical protein